MIEISRIIPSIISDAQETVEKISENMGDNRIDTVIASLFEDIDRSVELLKDEDSSSDAIRRICGILINIQNEFRGHLLTTKTLAVGFGIQSATIPEAEKRFGPFIIELQEFISKIEVTLSELEAHTKKNIEDADQRAEVIAKSVTELSRLKDLSRAEMMDALREWEKVNTHLSASMQAIEVIAHRITKATGAIVSLLQTGDRVRQAMEHVHSSLKSIDGSAIQIDLCHMTVPKRKRALGKNLALLKLQAAQLSNIQADLVSGRDGIISHFNEIRDCVSELQVKADLTLNNADASTGPQKLIGQLNKLDDLVRKIAEELGTSCQARQEALEDMLTIRNHVNAIEETGFEMKVNSLNAVINASQLGKKAAPLAVLAEETMRLSEVMDNSISLVMKEAEVLDIEEGNSDDGFEVDATQAEFSKIRKALTDSDTICSEKQKSIHDGTYSVQATVANTSTQIDELNQLISDMEDAQSEISTFLGSCESLFGVEWILSQLEQDQGKYTMAQERAVHEHLSAHLKQPQTRDRSADDSHEEFFFDDEADDGVDLFDDPETSKTELPEQSQTSDSITDDNIELFDDDDGIELFDENNDIELFNEGAATPEEQDNPEHQNS